MLQSSKDDMFWARSAAGLPAAEGKKEEGKVTTLAPEERGNVDGHGSRSHGNGQPDNSTTRLTTSLQITWQWTA